MTVAELSRRSGVSYDTLNKLKRREGSSTSAENAELLRAALSPSTPPRADTPALQRVEPGDQPPADTALVPVYDVEASAGDGAIVDEEYESHSLAFPPAYLGKITKGPTDKLSIISVKGESMEPTLLDDDIVLLDGHKTDISYDGLFVLRFNTALHVKRIGRSAKPDHIMVISDNRDLYPPLDMRISDVTAVGKVLWYGRKV